jgi:hypothetical protein
MDKSLNIALQPGGQPCGAGRQVHAYLNTGSLAPYSDALESIINVTSIAAVIAIRIAARPADAGHPYGYHKAEYMSAVVIGARGNPRQCHRCYRDSCLRTRHAGKATFVDFDLVVSGKLASLEVMKDAICLKRLIKRCCRCALSPSTSSRNTRRSIVEFWSYDPFAGYRVNE